MVRIHLHGFTIVNRLMLRVDKGISSEIAISLVPAIADLVGTERLNLDGKANRLVSEQVSDWIYE